MPGLDQKQMGEHTLRLINQVLRLILNRFGKKRNERLISHAADLAGINMLSTAHRCMGIMKYENMAETGEKYFVQCLLPKIITKPNPVLVDVGANVGEFSRLLRSQFAQADIYAFEPVPSTFDQLQKSLEKQNVKCLNFGLSDKEASVCIYQSSRGELNPLASLYPAVAESIHHFQDVVRDQIQVRMLDNVADEFDIYFIDLLKIDTEGHEFAVLNGGLRIIQSNRVGLVLFEFNEMNVVSKVFLRDFYSLLPGYHFYRLDSGRLVPLGAYKPVNEIFQFQNILAVNSEFYPKEWFK